LKAAWTGWISPIRTKALREPVEDSEEGARASRNFPVEKEIRCLAQRCKHIILMQHLKASRYNKLSLHRALIIEAFIIKFFRKVGGNQMRGDDGSLSENPRPLSSCTFLIRKLA
jgi:hypothetical protein